MIFVQYDTALLWLYAPKIYEFEQINLRKCVFIFIIQTLGVCNIFYAHQSYIYFINNTVKIVIF